MQSPKLAPRRDQMAVVSETQAAPNTALTSAMRNPKGPSGKAVAKWASGRKPAAPGGWRSPKAAPSAAISPASNQPKEGEVASAKYTKAAAPMLLWRPTAR